MAISGKSAKDCFQHYRDFVQGVVQRTLVTDDPIVLIQVPGQECKRTLQLGHYKSKHVSLYTPGGDEVRVTVQQNLEAVQQSDKQYHLKTRDYWYKLYDPAGDKALGLDTEPLFRWEFVYDPRGQTWCRHHFQVGKVLTNSNGTVRGLTVPWAEGEKDLNRLHVPTGFMLMEYFFQFLIHEFDVASKPDWKKVLDDAVHQYINVFSMR